MYRKKCLLLFFIIFFILYFILSVLSYYQRHEKTVLEKTLHSGQYCVIYNYWEMKEEFTKNHITLVLHSTVDYLQHLKEHLRTWQGGISVAVLVPNPGNITNQDVIYVSESTELFQVTYACY